VTPGEPITAARRLAYAVPAVAVAAAVEWLPPAQRPPLAPWLAGTAVLAGLVCLVSRRRPGTAGLCAAATVLGALVQLRLGQPASRLAVPATLGAAAWAAGVQVGRSGRFARMLTGSSRCRAVAVGAVAAGTALRALALLGPHPAAGTLPLVPVQVGELTRYLVGGGVALGVAELAACRLGCWRPGDARFRAVLAGLAVAATMTLVLLRDLGPAVLVAVGIAAALVHAHGFRPRGSLVTLGLVAVTAPLLAGSAVVRTRLEHVVDPDPQLRSALVAAGSGGLIGPGPGRSPLVDGIPAIGSDFALSALTADLGALVVVPVVVALLVGYATLARAAARHPGAAGTVAVALSCMLLAQAAWNALGTLAVLPLTGLNQPFLGLSGMSLAVSAGVVGLVLGLLDSPDGDGLYPGTAAGSAPGTGAVGTLIRSGTAGVVLLLVVAAGMVAIDARPVGDLEQTRMPRGVLWTADGQVVSRDGHRERIYPAGALYADLGRDTWGYSHRGIDATDAHVLTCGGRLHLTDWLSSLVHTVCKPADVITTVDSRVQIALGRALAGRTGEAVLLDARTGAVLGLYSAPAPAADATSAARFALRPPGSTMKLITASASLLTRVDYSAAPARDFVGTDGQRLGNDHHETCPATDVRTALAYSCNSVLGWAAARVGAPQLQRVAATYFGADRPFTLEGGDAYGLSTGLPSTGRVTEGTLARTGIGQESVRSTVLGVALATAVVANSGGPASGGQTTGGVTPWPHLTAATCADPGAAGGGEPVATPTGPSVGPALPPAVGRVVYDGMRMAVTSGTARSLGSVTTRQVVAKTGTAQTTGGRIDSWLTAVVDHRYVLTLVIADAADEAAGVRAGASVLAVLPSAVPVLSCAHAAVPGPVAG
jgi:peptidoglycan glycosyltransferase